MRYVVFRFRVSCVQLLWLPVLMVGCAEKPQAAESPVFEASEISESCEHCETPLCEMATEPGPFENLPMEPLAAELPADPVQRLQALVQQGRCDEVLIRLAKLDLPAAQALPILRRLLGRLVHQRIIAERIIGQHVTRLLRRPGCSRSAGGPACSPEKCGRQFLLRSP